MATPDGRTTIHFLGTPAADYVQSCSYDEETGQLILDRAKQLVFSGQEDDSVAACKRIIAALNSAAL